jgi:hypothetical protein
MPAPFTRLAPLVITPFLLATTAWSQDLTFQTPGLPIRPGLTQTDRFSNDFNPAFGGVFDADLSYWDSEMGDQSGFDIRLRSLEGTMNTWIDPNTWAYAVIVATEDEIELEEAAAIYKGIGERSQIRAGRFFVDFGKQMQAHVHEIATFDRPGVLREYLGEELAGTGVQYDNWFPVGDDTAVRFSLAAFDSLVSGHGHGEEEEEGPAAVVPDRGTIGELSFTGRLTGFTDVSSNGVLQGGLSWRGLPEFAFDADLDDGTELMSSSLSNNVFGADLTYGWVSDDTNRSWTLGSEFLIFDGDLAAEVNDGGTPGVFGDDSLDIMSGDRSGYYVWAEHGWQSGGAPYSLGMLYSAFEHTDDGAAEDRELTLYLTHYLTDFSRIRVGLTHFDRFEGGDETAFMVQFTNFFGSHAHGLNW